MGVCVCHFYFLFFFSVGLYCNTLEINVFQIHMYETYTTTLHQSLLDIL